MWVRLILLSRNASQIPSSLCRHDEMPESKGAGSFPYPRGIPGSMCRCRSTACVPSPGIAQFRVERLFGQTTYEVMRERERESAISVIRGMIEMNLANGICTDLPAKHGAFKSRLSS